MPPVSLLVQQFFFIFEWFHYWQHKLAYGCIADLRKLSPVVFNAESKPKDEKSSPTLNLLVCQAQVRHQIMSVFTTQASYNENSLS